MASRIFLEQQLRPPSLPGRGERRPPQRDALEEVRDLLGRPRASSIGLQPRRVVLAPDALAGAFRQRSVLDAIQLQRDALAVEGVRLAPGAGIEARGDQGVAAALQRHDAHGRGQPLVPQALDAAHGLALAAEEAQRVDHVDRVLEVVGQQVRVRRGLAMLLRDAQADGRAPHSSRAVQCSGAKRLLKPTIRIRPRASASSASARVSPLVGVAGFSRNTSTPFSSRAWANSTVRGRGSEHERRLRNPGQELVEAGAAVRDAMARARQLDAGGGAAVEKQLEVAARAEHGQIGPVRDAAETDHSHSHGP